MTENNKPLIDGLRDRHLADTFLTPSPPVGGPVNSPDIARIAAISNNQNGARGNVVFIRPVITGYADGALSGSSQENVTVQIYINSEDEVDAVADASGHWTAEVEVNSGDVIVALAEVRGHGGAVTSATFVVP